MTQPDYKPYIGELLKVAGASGANGAESSLITHLEIARATVGLERQRQKQPPAEFFEKVQNHLRQAIASLEQLERHADWSGVCFEMYVAGGGIAESLTTRELFERGEITLPRHPKIEPEELPADGKLIAVNAKEVLRSVKHKIERQRKKPPRGGQRKEDQAASVSYAKDFFVRHSPHKPSTDPKSNFAEFCRLFFRAISGADAPSGLDWHIREALKD
jgi:hypothetical protein